MLRVQLLRVHPHLLLVEVEPVFHEADILQHIRLEPRLEQITAEHLVPQQVLDEQRQLLLLRLGLGGVAQLEAQEPEDVGQVGVQHGCDRSRQQLRVSQQVAQLAHAQRLPGHSPAELVEHELQRMSSTWGGRDGPQLRMPHEQEEERQSWQ